MVRMLSSNVDGIESVYRSSAWMSERRRPSSISVTTALCNFSRFVCYSSDTQIHKNTMVDATNKIMQMIHMIQLIS